MNIWSHAANYFPNKKNCTSNLKQKHSKYRGSRGLGTTFDSHSKGSGSDPESELCTDFSAHRPKPSVTYAKDETMQM
jgi:hypothetical protein